MGDLRVNPFINPVDYSNYERGSRAVGVNPFAPTQQGGQHTGISNINGEVVPKYLETASSGSTHTNGLGHSNFGAFRPYLA